MRGYIPVLPGHTRMPGHRSLNIMLSATISAGEVRFLQRSKPNTNHQLKWIELCQLHQKVQRSGIEIARTQTLPFLQLIYSNNT